MNNKFKSFFVIATASLLLTTSCSDNDLVSSTVSDDTNSPSTTNPNDTEHSGNIENPGNPDDSGNTEDPGNTDNPGNPEDSGNTDNPGNHEDPGNTDNPGNPEDPGNTDNPGNPEDPGNTDNPGNPENPGNTDNPGNPEDPGNTQEPETPSEPVAEADLIDVVFNLDGSAKNIAPTNLSVEQNSTGGLISYYNSNYKRYVAHFNNELSGAANNYYKIDYTNNTAFQNALKDGHSIEAVFRLDSELNASKEAKFFASHQSGGTGFLISKSEKGQDITFLPYVGGNYVWVGSGIKPVVGRYYHVVGVWDKTNGTASIYVNGELKKKVAASGDLKLGSQLWFGVGCDAGTSGELSWNGDVAIARVYDKPLNQDSVTSLYNKVALADPDHFVIQDIDARGTGDVKAGYQYHFYGDGFAVGDSIELVSTATGDKITCATTVENGRITAIIPDGIATGDYDSFVVRGDEVYPLASGTLTVTSAPGKQTNVKCAAHRGYHKSAPENSIASLVAAQNLDVYGSEFDVWMTTDNNDHGDGLFINHDGTLSGVKIQDSKTATVSKLTLSNGESIPTLRAYLEQGKKKPSVKMILEIKSHSNADRNKAVTAACIKMVQELGVEDQVEWIAFSYNNCLQIRQALPNAVVQYLNGDKAPSAVAKDKISAIDYKTTVLTDNSTWITEAHNNGIFVNVWTVGKSDFTTWINKGVDVITTNDAEDLMKILTVYIEK